MISNAELAGLKGWQRIRSVLPHLAIGLILAVSSSYWTIETLMISRAPNVSTTQEEEAQVRLVNNINELKLTLDSLQTKVKQLTTDTNDILASSPNQDTNNLAKIKEIHNKLEAVHSQIRVLKFNLPTDQMIRALMPNKNWVEGLYEHILPEFRSVVPYLSISNAFAAESGSKSTKILTTESRDKSRIANVETITIIVLAVLGLIVLSTISSFGILIFSGNEKKIKFAMDTLKISSGFYFDIINGVLGLK